MCMSLYGTIQHAIEKKYDENKSSFGFGDALGAKPQKY